MSFADALKRLRAATEFRQPGRKPEYSEVRRADLLELLHHFDRLDADARAQTPHRESQS